MGVFSYLNIKRPASFIWKTFSPGRELGEEKSGNGSDLSMGTSDGSENDQIRPNASEPIDERRASSDHVAVTTCDKSEFAPNEAVDPSLTMGATSGFHAGPKLQGQLSCGDVFAGNQSAFLHKFCLKGSEVLKMADLGNILMEVSN